MRGRMSAGDEANQAAAKPSRTAVPADCCLPESGSSRAMLVERPPPVVAKPGWAWPAFGRNAVPGCPGCCPIHAATAAAFAASLPPAVTRAGNSSQPRSRSDTPAAVTGPGGRCRRWSYSRRSFSARAAGEASSAARSSNVRTPRAHRPSRSRSFRATRAARVPLRPARVAATPAGFRGLGPRRHVRAQYAHRPRQAMRVRRRS